LAVVASVASGALTLLAADPSEAIAEPLPQARIVDLRVEDDPGWHADDSFDLDWDFEVPPGAPAVTAVHYRVRYPDGRDAVAERVIPAGPRVEGIHLPANGAFVAEAWAEDAVGRLSAHASVGLLLDQARPGSTQPTTPAGWVAGGAAIHLRMGRPEGAAPISGLRGYAVSIDADPTGSPCAHPERCSDRELDLRGGVEDDSLILTGLPEGRLFVHAVAVSGSGMRSQQVGTAALRVDATAPAVSISSAPADWASGPVRLQASASDDLSGMRADGPSGPFTAISIDGGASTLAFGDSASAVVGGNGVHRVEIRARDAAGNLSARAGQPPLTATVRIDGEPPRVAFANGFDPADPQRLEANVADALSGPSSRRGSIAVRPARSHQNFAPLATTVSGSRLLAHWDADDHTAGTYEFQATAYDAAGNSARTTLRSNGTRLVQVSAEKTRTVLRGGFGRDRAATKEVPCGHGAIASGRLATANGSPLAGEEIEVGESFDFGAAVPRTSTVRTAADGSFAFRLGVGPSRRVELSFAGSRGRVRSVAPPLRLEAQSCVTMRASTRSARIGGRPVVFSGRVGLSAAAPPGGIPVELQFRLPGLPWSEFRTVASDRHGRFRYPYAFADDDSRGVRFQFRAVVAARDGWPYATGASRPVTVTGR
jgi:hypothetical protein